MRLITIGDIIDTYSKARQRGSSFILSKFTFNKNKRSISAFDASAIYTSNWWIIPKVKERWNFLISGHKNINYKAYFVEHHLKNKTNLKLLSLGSGNCFHERELSKYPQFKKVTCVDINQQNLDEAQQCAIEEGLNNIEFICKDISSFDFKNEHYDIVMFHASLHHFANVNQLLEEKIKPCLTKNGLLIINEFVGPKRMQFPKQQIKAINKALKIIPKPYRKRFKTNMFKNKYYGLGLLRVIIADPSECIDSNNIIPSIHHHFKIIEEKPYGGNILANVLREISHHFVELNDEKVKILEELFKFEDKYLEDNTSNFIFGIYQKD